MKTRIRVLIIDDEMAIRESLAEFLEDFDFVVSTTDSAEEALLLLAEQPFDIAVADVRLPGMNGDEFVETAAALYPQMRFLFHTGSVSFSLNPKLEKLGLTNDHILRKPMEDLTHAVRIIEQLMK